MMRECLQEKKIKQKVGVKLIKKSNALHWYAITLYALNTPKNSEMHRI